MCPATKVVSISPSKFLKQRYIITLHLTVRKSTHHMYHKKTEMDLNKIHPTTTCNGVSAVSSMSTNNEDIVLFPPPHVVHKQISMHCYETTRYIMTLNFKILNHFVLIFLQHFIQNSLDLFQSLSILYIAPYFL
jgi:hypothetical protein